MFLLFVLKPCWQFLFKKLWPELDVFSEKSNLVSLSNFWKAIPQLCDNDITCRAYCQKTSATAEVAGLNLFSRLVVGMLENSALNNTQWYYTRSKLISSPATFPWQHTVTPYITCESRFPSSFGGKRTSEGLRLAHNQKVMSYFSKLAMILCYHYEYAANYANWRGG